MRPITALLVAMLYGCSVAESHPAADCPPCPCAEAPAVKTEAPASDTGKPDALQRAEAALEAAEQALQAPIEKKPPTAK